MEVMSNTACNECKFLRLEHLRERGFLFVDRHGQLGMGN